MRWTFLERLGVDNLTFGTEENLDYQHFSQIYADNQQKMVDYLQIYQIICLITENAEKCGETFAGVNFTGNTPNHILGFLCKACAGKSIKLSPIMRQGAGYHSLETDVAFASATNLRIHRQDKAFVDKFMPQADLFLSTPQSDWENYFQLLRVPNRDKPLI